MSLINDDQDRMLELLEVIARNTGDLEARNDVTINAQQRREQSARYFSSGEDRLAVEATGEQFTEVEFGFVAKAVNLRTTDDVVIAFEHPTQNPGRTITVRSDESPFSIGGVVGINTDTIWVQQADSADTTPGVEILAYK